MDIEREVEEGGSSVGDLCRNGCCALAGGRGARWNICGHWSRPLDPSDPGVRAGGKGEQRFVRRLSLSSARPPRAAPLNSKPACIAIPWVRGGSGVLSPAAPLSSPLLPFRTSDAAAPCGLTFSRRSLQSSKCKVLGNTKVSIETATEEPQRICTQRTDQAHFPTTACEEVSIDAEGVRSLEMTYHARGSSKQEQQSQSSALLACRNELAVHKLRGKERVSFARQRFDGLKRTSWYKTAEQRMWVSSAS